MYKHSTLAASAILGIAALVATSSSAFADGDTTQPTRNGWTWVIDGVQYGTCPSGYSVQLNHITSPETGVWGIHKPGDSPYWETVTFADAMAQLKSDPNNPEAVAYEMGDWGVGTPANDQTETTMPRGTTPDPSAAYEGDCVRNDLQLTPGGGFRGGDTTEPYTPPVYPIAHTVTTPPTTTTTHVPATTRTITTPGRDLVWVQIDTYHDSYSNGRRMTPTQIAKREAARRSDKARGTLLYRQGSAATWLWGSTSSVIKVVDLCQPQTLGADTDEWALGNGATKANPWGASRKVAQTVPRAVCKSTTTTVVVTPAHDVTVTVPGATKTVWVCPDGTTVPNATTACHVTGGRGGMGG